MNLTAPTDIAGCLITSSGGALFELAYFGWSLTLGVEKGLAVGGFLMSLIGVIGLVFGYINIVSVMFAIMLMVIGALIIVLQNAKGG